MRCQPIRRILGTAAACAVVMMAASSLAATGDVWRRHDRYDPYRGPATLALPTQSGGSSVPPLSIVVRDGKGKPVPGVGVQVKVHVKKKKGRTVRVEGATDADGQIRLAPGKIAGWKDVQLRFRWDGGYKIVDAYLVPGENGRWKLDRTPYENVVEDEKEEGSCKNLFSLETAEGEALLRFRLPSSILECEKVEYGVARKSATFANVADVGHRDLNRGDKNFFNEKFESDLGMEAARTFDQQYEVLDDPRITGYVEKVLEKVVAASDDPSMDVRLRVVHTGDVNAFATAGGNVYVFTGLIAAAENEAQLAGVIAHELTHVLSRHVTEGATRQLKTQVGTLLGAFALGTALKLEDNQQQAVLQGGALAGGLAGMKYDRRAETEADLLGMQYLWNAGWDPEAIPQFFAILEKKYGASGPGWLSDHPTHERRVQNGILWARSFLPARDRYLVDTQGFEDTKALVATLPPPKKQPKTEGQGTSGLLSGSAGYRAVMERGIESVLGGTLNTTE